MRPGALVPVLLLISTLAAAQQFGPEVPVSAPGLLFPTPSAVPRLASNGNGFLAVWSDGRASADVYAARVDARGAVLDPAGILVKHLAGSAAVASDGRDYLVAIADACTAISVVRVAADGTPGELKQVANDRSVCSNVEIASNGESYLAVWLPGRAALLDRDGNIITGPFNIGLPQHFYRIAVASNGRDYAIVGVIDSPQTAVVTVPVSGHGDVGSTHSVFASRIPDVAIASDGTGYLIAAASESAVRAVRLGPDAMPSGPEVDQISAGTTFTPRVAWNGSQYVIGYVESIQSGPALRLIVLDPYSSTIRSGALIGGVPPQSPIAPHDLVSSKGEVLIAWTRDNKTFVSLVSGADVALGQELSGATLASAPVSQSGPLLISNGGSTVAFWREGAASLLRAAVLTSDGRPLSAPVDIAQIYGPDYHAAFAGSIIVVTWKANSNLYVRRYTSTLQPIDANAVPIQNAGAPWQPYALAATDGVALLVWSAPNGMTDSLDDVYGALVRTDGPAMTATPVMLPQLPFADDDVSAAWNGSEFLVAWAHAVGPPPLQGLFPGPPSEVLAVRISPGGVVLDSAPIVVTSLGGSTTTASNGRDFFVAWSDGNGIYGKAVGADGSVSGDAPTQLWPSSPSDLVLLPNEGQFILLWTLRVNPFVYPIYLRMLDAGGKPGTVTLLPQFERSSAGGGASLAVTPAGLVVIYARLAGEPQFAGVSRVFTRTVVPSAGRRRAIPRS